MIEEHKKCPKCGKIREQAPMGMSIQAVQEEYCQCEDFINESAQETKTPETPIEQIPATPVSPEAPKALEVVPTKREKMIDRVSSDFAIEFSEQFQMASTLSKSGILGKNLDTPEKLFLLLQQGKELGLQPMQSLNNIYVVNGKTAISSKMMLSLAIRAGIKYEFVTWTAEKCEIIFTRGDWSMNFDYTIDEARLAGLLSKDNWRAYPKEMLKSRCISRGLSLIAPDVIGGLYEESELVDAMNVTNTDSHILETTPEDKTAATVQNTIREVYDSIQERIGNVKKLSQLDSIKKQIEKNRDLGMFNDEDNMKLSSLVASKEQELNSVEKENGTPKDIK